MLAQYDDIVVGAGSSGCVVASRLSEDANRKVLLVEAGPDYTEIDSMPEQLLCPNEPSVDGTYNWDVVASMSDGSNGSFANMTSSLKDAGSLFSAADSTSKLKMAKSLVSSAVNKQSVLDSFNYPVGKVSGGSSSVNGCLAIRGTIDDYEEWDFEDDSCWYWPNILKTFKDLETDADNQGPYFGNSGPIPISRPRLAELHPLQEDFMKVCQNFGFPVGDLNNPNATGLGRVPRNIQNSHRVSTLMAYLNPVRRRENLTVLSKATVEKVLFDGKKATGIRVLVDGVYQSLYCDRVVISAGAINTPAILMRSGIGGADKLKNLGIDIKADLPGVGENLSDHAAVGLWMIPQAGMCKENEEIHQLMLRYTSEQSETANDMALFMLNSVKTSVFPELEVALGSPLAMAVSVVLGKPESRGRVDITSRSADASPSVVLNCAEAASDRRKLMDGVRTAWEMIHDEPLVGKYQKIFAWNERIVSDDELLEKAVKTFVRGSWHAAGTAKMGKSTDPYAVVDSYGCVYGVDQLQVVDASIMPTIPRSPTFLSCVMLAEVISKHITSRS